MCKPLVEQPLVKHLGYGLYSVCISSKWSLEGFNDLVFIIKSHTQLLIT